MTRNGKIARLPLAIREQLNSRLAEGEPGIRLIQWLNSLPEVQTLLVQDFGGRPINGPNLTEWKQGGFEEWLRREEARDWAAQFIEESTGLERDFGSVSVAERATLPALVTLSRLLHQALASEHTEKRTKTIIAITQEISQLRRAQLDADRLHLHVERLALKQPASLASEALPPAMPHL